MISSLHTSILSRAANIVNLILWCVKLFDSSLAGSISLKDFGNLLVFTSSGKRKAIYTKSGRLSLTDAHSDRTSTNVISDHALGLRPRQLKHCVKVCHINISVPWESLSLRMYVCVFMRVCMSICV